MSRKLSDRYEVLTSNGFQNFHGIKKTKRSSMKIRFSDGTEIVCSYNHKFYENDTFIYANVLKVGDTLSGKTISDICDNGVIDLFDLLEVENGHHYTANGVESSNCAFVPKNVWNRFYTSTWPTLSSGKETRFIMVSTPNSKNHFYDFWVGAKSGKNNFTPLEVNWWDVPGRDEEWRQNQLKMMSEEEFNIEYGNSFDATSNTLISSHVFSRLEAKTCDPIQHIKTTRIYELPADNHIYIVTVDCADTGEDFSTISIIDITEYPYRQVAVFSDNKISHLSLPQVIVNMGMKYNNADVLVESNDIGKTVLHILNYDLEYENIIRSTKNVGGLSELGQRTTSKTKSSGCSRLKDMIEKEGIIIYDRPTLSELRHFCLKGKSYQAESGFHDDIVMGLVNFAYYATTKQFKMKYDTNFTDEFRKSTDYDIMESLTPLPLFSSMMTDNNNAWSKEDIMWLNS